MPRKAPKRKKAPAKRRGGRIVHKFPLVSKTASRRLAQQQKSRKKAWGLLRANKGGASRHRVGGTRRTRRSVFSTPGWRKQLAQSRGIGRRPGVHRGKIGHKHGKKGGWLPIVGSILAGMLMN